VRVALLLLLAAGCGSSSTAPADMQQLNLFVADESSFAGYQAWRSWQFMGPASADGFVHPAGLRTIWINMTPPSGSTTFPVGTVIVKTITPPDPATQAFAMAKRGGDYNSGGASGWEWFSLDVTMPATPAIVWRGTAPPNGSMYAGTTGDDCNGCHGKFTQNDSVQSPPLQLGNF
jgi:hypothetical protein